MIDLEVSGKLTALLHMAAHHLHDWLSDVLPKIDSGWWSALVLPSLSYQQRQRVDQKSIDSMSELDLAALLRVLDRNWYEISSKFSLTNQDRNYVKEMQTVRNRWAHLDIHGVEPDDIYRDVDTLQRFLQVIEAPSSTISAIMQVKRQVLGADKPAPRPALEAEPSNEPELPVKPVVLPPKAGFQIGSLVALVSDPKKTGAVMRMDGLGDAAIPGHSLGTSHVRRVAISAEVPRP